MYLLFRICMYCLTMPLSLEGPTALFCSLFAVLHLFSSILFVSFQLPFHSTLPPIFTVSPVS